MEVDLPGLQPVPSAAILRILSLVVLLQGSLLRAAPSLEESIAHAKPGETLVIAGPAVCEAHLVINKPLRLIGTNSAVIDGQSSGSVVSIRAPGVEVRGLTIRNSGSDLGNFDSGILIEAPGATVAGCRIEGGGFGLYVHGVDNCRLEGNTILGNTNVAASKRGNGIHLWKTKGNLIAGNFISATRDGAYFSYADKNLIVSNRIEGTRFGIHYMYSNRNRLEGNAFTGNAVGAALMFARDCEVTGNRAFANRRHGILLKQVENSTFYRNSVYGQNRGFFVQQAVADRFEENAIVENDIGLYLSNGSEQNVFVGNAFVHNSDQVWQPEDEVEKGRLAANRFNEGHRGNYWSDYTGSDANGDGIGDTPYHETNLYGYIVDHHPEARLFALSPAAALLRKGEELVPLLNTEGVTDLYPQQQPSPAVLGLLREALNTSPHRLASAK